MFKKIIIIIIFLGIPFDVFAVYTYDQALALADGVMGSSNCKVDYRCQLGSGSSVLYLYRISVYSGNVIQIITYHYDSATVACPVGYERKTVFSVCTPESVTCNTVPTITNVGASQTASWQLYDPNTNTCISNSITCDYPLVANIEMKRCDLSCSDGSTVNVSGGAQCPPPTCYGEQILNTATNSCVDPTCAVTEVLDTTSHICQPLCVGQQVQNTSASKYTCADPVCGSTEWLNTVTHICVTQAICTGTQTYDFLSNSCVEPVCTGMQLLNSTTHICEDPAPAECTGSQVLNTATNSCLDPVCPSGYHLNAGKVCESDGECPLFEVKQLVDGVIKCVSSVIPGGGTDGTGTGTGGTGTDPSGKCDDCAKESTLQQLSKKLDANPGTSASGTGDAGKWYEPTDKTYQSIIQGGISQIQNTPIMSFGKDIFNVTIPEGTPPVWTLPAVMGLPEIPLPSLASDLMDPIWLIVSSVLKIISVLMAFRIAISAV